MPSSLGLTLVPHAKHWHSCRDRAFPNSAYCPNRYHLEAFLQQGCEAVLAEVYGCTPRPAQKLLHTPWRQSRIAARSPAREYCTRISGLRLQHPSLRCNLDVGGACGNWSQNRHSSWRRLVEPQLHNHLLTPSLDAALRQWGGRRGFAAGNSKSRGTLTDSMSPR